jgi:tRNA threonylcarbamoyladenosine biosynthesis protein TsaB
MDSKYILCLDASVQTASAALSSETGLPAVKICEQQREHAAFLQPAINDLLAEQNINLSQLTAVAVTAGPGSYTGLRIAMASAKGLCYALNIPMITLSTLEVMATVAIQHIKPEEPFLLCPLIDARRMEVFTAVYDKAMEEVMKPQALILDETSFQAQLNNHVVYFFGNGAAKWQAVCHHPNARFVNVEWNAKDMMRKAWELYHQSKFASLAYAAPFYGKEFYNTSK